jgi:geranylgeranyl pyrophosphate synthase
MHRISKLDEQASHAQPLDLLKDVEDRVSLALPCMADTDQGEKSTARGAAWHHLSAKGQRLRTRLALDATLALGLCRNDAIAIAAAVELLHNASLIHDDLQDRDRIRRGRKSVWAAYGDDIAICAGDLLLSGAYQSLATFSKPERIAALISLTHARTALAISGQCADLRARRGARVGISGYERIVAAKSGALIALPLELALLASDNSAFCAQARRAAESFAIGYQIVDDIEDRDADARTPGSLNISAVLGELDLERDTLQQARGLGLKHLSDAATAALLLPLRCGDLLREFALRVSAQL